MILFQCHSWLQWFGLDFHILVEISFFLFMVIYKLIWFICAQVSLVAINSSHCNNITGNWFTTQCMTRFKRYITKLLDSNWTDPILYHCNISVSMELYSRWYIHSQCMAEKASTFSLQFSIILLISIDIKFTWRFRVIRWG